MTTQANNILKGLSPFHDWKPATSAIFWNVLLSFKHWVSNNSLLSLIAGCSQVIGAKVSGCSGLALPILKLCQTMETCFLYWVYHTALSYRFSAKIKTFFLAFFPCSNLKTCTTNRQLNVIFCFLHNSDLQGLSINTWWHSPWPSLQL